MKQLKTMILLLALPSFLLAQTKEGKISYEVKMNMHKQLPAGQEQMKEVLPEFITSRIDLCFNEYESLTTSKNETADVRDEVSAPKGNHVMMAIKPAIMDVEMYKNYRTRQQVIVKQLGPKKYLVQDSVAFLMWKLEEGEKKISGYDCKKATAINKKGESVVAWYSGAILCAGGPDIYGGLPGMILALDINDGTLQYAAISVGALEEGKNVKIPEKGKKISAAAFEKLIVDEPGMVRPVTKPFNGNF